MNKNSKFQKGSGVFNCDICGKATRETGKGEANFRLCAGCIEVSQVENGHSDGDHEGEVWDCEECATWLSPQGKEHLDIYRKAQAGMIAEAVEADPNKEITDLKLKLEIMTTAHSKLRAGVVIALRHFAKVTDLDEETAVQGMNEIPDIVDQITNLTNITIG